MAGYVDDILVAEWEQHKLLAIFDFGEKFLDLFNYSFKGMNYAGEKEDTKTLDHEGKMGVVGYWWRPNEDTFSIKCVTISSGSKINGRWVRQSQSKTLPDPPPLRTKTLVEPEDFEILEGKPKNLRLVASMAASCFDLLGFCSPLVGQLRNSVSYIIKNSNKAGWEYIIPNDQWEFFLKMLLELYKTSQHKFPRHPPTQGNNLHGKLTLFVCSDASLRCSGHSNQTFERKEF